MRHVVFAMGLMIALGVQNCSRRYIPVVTVSSDDSVMYENRFWPPADWITFSHSLIDRGIDTIPELSSYDTVMVKMLCSYTQGIPTMVLDGYRVGNQYIDRDRKLQPSNIIVWMSRDFDWVSGKPIER